MKRELPIEESAFWWWKALPATDRWLTTRKSLRSRYILFFILFWPRTSKNIQERNEQHSRLKLKASLEQNFGGHRKTSTLCDPRCESIRSSVIWRPCNVTKRPVIVFQPKCTATSLFRFSPLFFFSSLFDFNFATSNCHNHLMLQCARPIIHARFEAMRNSSSCYHMRAQDGSAKSRFTWIQIIGIRRFARSLMLRQVRLVGVVFRNRAASCML